MQKGCIIINTVYTFYYHFFSSIFIFCRIKRSFLADWLVITWIYLKIQYSQIFFVCMKMLFHVAGLCKAVGLIVWSIRNKIKKPLCEPSPSLGLILGPERSGWKKMAFLFVSLNTLLNIRFFYFQCIWNSWSIFCLCSSYCQVCWRVSYS